jgi:diguanylate cyclase (GGDEF)-like protein
MEAMRGRCVVRPRPVEAMSGAALDPRQARSGERSLSDSVRELSSTLASREVLTRLRDRALLHLDAQIASVLTFVEPGVLSIAAARGLPREVVARTRIPLGEGISGHVARAGEPLWVPDIEVDPRFARANHPRYFTTSLVSVPIAFRGRVRGVVNVTNKRSREPLSPDDLALLDDLAAHAAVALANAERYEALLERAQQDPLTGLLHHGQFWCSLKTEVARARRYGRPLSVAMIDIDHFKGLNDRHGHLAGDRVLAGVASAIQRLCRESDVAARYGGEEFAVALPETPIEGALHWAEKIRRAIAEGALGAEPITVSVGIAALDADAPTPRRLVDAADRQLYRAKALGRDRVCAPDEGATV